MEVPQNSQTLSRFDYALVGLFCFLLFGYSCIGGRPLTMHEARLPETSREMRAAGEWLLPRSGIRPWLERPPLPHWIVISMMKIFHQDKAVWAVRLPSVLMGLITVLCTMWMANRLLSRSIALVSAMVLATSYEIWQYSGFAEDDIYLGALVAVCMVLFVRVEFPRSEIEKQSTNFFTWRRWEILLIFILAGATNLAKGPLMGLMVIAPTFGAYVFWAAIADRNWKPLFRYTWLWGWLVTIAIGAAWPMWAYHVYPDVLQNWKYDYVGRMNGAYTDINQPWWYYGFALSCIALVPWTPICFLGLWASVNRFGFAKSTRFVWCWAIAPVLLYSIPHGKHHHYLIPFIAPWAILGAVGLVQIADWLKMSTTVRVALMRTIAIVMLVGYSVGDTLLAPPTDHTVQDTQFLRRADKEMAHDIPLYINGKPGPIGNLDFFRIQFYSRAEAILLHNLTFLRDEKITANKVYVITRAKDLPFLQQLGTVAVIDHSTQSHESKGPAGLFTLYELTFDPSLKRYPAPQKITTMQAMERDLSGPWCGPAT